MPQGNKLLNNNVPNYINLVTAATRKYICIFIRRKTMEITNFKYIIINTLISVVKNRQKYLLFFLFKLSQSMIYQI